MFEISPIKVTGRAVEPDLRDEQSDRVAGSPEEADEPPSDLHLESDAAEDLASVLHWVLGEEIADADNATVRRNLEERHRLLEGIAARADAVWRHVRRRDVRQTMFDQER